MPARFWLLLLGALLFSSAQSGAAPQVIDRIFLIVNSQMMTQSEAEDIVRSLKAQIQQAIPEGPERDRQFAEVDRTTVDSLIQELLLLDRARVLRIEISDKEVDAQLDRISESNPQLLTVMPESELQLRIVKDLKKQRVLSREVDSKIRVDGTEIQSACRTHRQSLRQISLSQILFRTSEVEAQNRTQEVRAALTAGKEFSAIAREVSDDPGAKKNGGALGKFQQGQLLPAIDQAAFTLPVAHPSELVQSQFGFHVLFITREAFPNAPDCTKLSAEQSDALANSVYQQKRNEAIQTYLNELRQSARITVKEVPSE